MVKSSTPINPAPSCDPVPPLGILQKDISLFNFLVKTIMEPLESSTGNKIKSTINTKTIVGSKQVASSNKTRETESNRISLNIVIPEFKFSIPSYTIHDFPTLNIGCNECEEEDTIPTCDIKVDYLQKCKKIFGKKICIKIPVFSATKCFYEVVKDDLTIPEIPIMDFKKTNIIFDFEILPDLDMDSDFSLGVTLTGLVVGTNGALEYAAAEATKDGVNTATAFASFTVTKFKIGFTMIIKRLEFTYNGKGLILENQRVKFLPTVDYCAGSKYISSTIDSTGSINVFYLIDNQDFTLHDILKPILQQIKPSNNLFVQLAQYETKYASEALGLDFDLNSQYSRVGGVNIDQNLYNLTPQIILNFLKQTDINIAFGLLICPVPKPEQPNFLSAWSRVKCTIKPFKDLNKVPPVNIPDDYLKIPKIPNSDYLPSIIRNQLNNYIQTNINSSLEHVNRYINPVVNFVKDTLENFPIPAPKTIVQIIIPKIP